MPRKVVPVSIDNYYHISARCINRDWFAMPMHEVWQIMEDQLYFMRHAYRAHISAFVLMSNHFHLLARFPESNMSECMQYFMRQTSRCIAKSADRINQTYGGRYHRSLISTEHYFSHAYKYVYRNPVEAGICGQVEEYPYSTLHGLLGRSRISIPVCDDVILFPSVARTLAWLNTSPGMENYKLMGSALRKAEFSIPKCRHTKKYHPLEAELY